MSVFAPFRGVFVYAPLYAKCLEHLPTKERTQNGKRIQKNAGKWGHQMHAVLKFCIVCSGDV